MKSLQLKLPLEGMKRIPAAGKDKHDAVIYKPSYASRSSPLSLEDRKWLEAFKKSHWLEGGPDQFGRRSLHENHKVRFSVEDVQRIFKLVQDHRMVAMIWSGTFGLSGFHLRVYQYHEEPFPGVGNSTEFVALISWEHLPDYPDGTDYGTRKKVEDQSWELFSAFSHSEENKAMLKSVGAELPRERSYYEY